MVRYCVLWFKSPRFCCLKLARITRCVWMKLNTHKKLIIIFLLWTFFVALYLHPWHLGQPILLNLCLAESIVYKCISKNWFEGKENQHDNYNAYLYQLLLTAVDEITTGNQPATHPYSPHIFIFVFIF